MSFQLTESDRKFLADLTLLKHHALTFANLDLSQPGPRDVHDKILDRLDQAAALDLRLLSCAEVIPLRHDLIRLNAIMHSTTEASLARLYLESGSNADPFAQSWMNKGFSDLLQHQVAQWSQAGILNDIREKSIIVVGGGALPQTQIFLHKVLKANVVCVEIDEESAQLCEDVIGKLGFSAQLKVICQDGADFDYVNSHIVVLATLVARKREVAQQIAKTAPRSYFAPRSPVGFHAMWREAINTAHLDEIGWQEISRLVPNGSSVASILMRLNNQRGSNA